MFVCGLCILIGLVFLIRFLCKKEQTREPPVYAPPVPSPSKNKAQPILMRQTNANQNQTPTAVNNPSNGSANAANQCNTR